MAFLTYPAAADGTADKAREIEELNDFIAHAPGDYDGGMKQVVLGHIMRETAKYCNCDFADICDPNHVLQAVREQQTSENDILICSPQPIDKNKKDTDLKTLAASLQAIKAAKKYKKVLLPIAASNYGVNHAMALCIEGDKAYLFEQLGGASYDEVKKDLAATLTGDGYTFTTNAQALTDGNRSDCATVSSRIILEAIQADSIETLSKQIAKKSPFFTHEEIDAHHKVDKDFAKAALKDINEGHRDDRNNSADIILLQQLLRKCSHDNLAADLKLAEEFWKAEDKAKFVAEYQAPQNDDTLNIDDKVHDSGEHDDGWKEEVRKAVGIAKGKEKTGFEEYDDPEHPERLCFRDGDDKMVFSSRSKVAVEGDIQTFRTLCQTAQELGYKAVNFGKFEEHPEYKAKLYLACLEKGLKMNNAPKLDELKEYPEYADIMKIYVPQKRKELGETLNASKTDFDKVNADAAKDAEYKRLTQELNDAKNKKDDAAVEKAQDALNANPTHQAVQKATVAYKKAMEASMHFYIEYGSEASKADETPEQRKEKLKKHLTQYDVKEFFSKDKDGNPITPNKEAAKKYAQSQRIAREIMGIKRSR